MSEWVLEEANNGKLRGILVPAKIDSVEPPLGFGLIQAADLTDWERETSHAGFESFVGAISEIVGPPPLKERETEEKRLEEERKREQEEERRLREAEQEKAEEERQRKEEEELRRKAEKEERERKEAEAKRKTKEEQKRRTAKEAIKTDKPKAAKIKPSEPHKKSNALKFGIIAGVVVLLIAVIWLFNKNQQEKQKNETRIKLEQFYEQVEELERSVAKADNQEKLKGLYRQRDKLSDQVAVFSEQATNFELESQLGQLQDRLKLIQNQLANKEKELFTTPKGRIFVASAPDNATVKILNIDEPFQQGMQLEPGTYHLQVSSEGYEPQERWIELGPGEEKRFSFELAKIIQKIARLFVETVPEEAAVRILNIKPRFSQGMELEPGSYHVEVAAEGYETERRWIDLVAGHEEPFKFKLVEIKVAEPISPQKTITNSIGMKFVLISAGNFAMGSQLSPEEVARRYGGKAEYFKDEQPRHPVEITKPFYLQTTEVSQAQWEKVMGNNPSRFKDCGEECPVEQVSWYDAQKFISKLNQMEGTNKYRLPTEAEWEYACRAGTTTPFFTGDCISTDQANYNGNYPGENCPKGQYQEKTVEVGSFQPNAWGLYDMHGNVWEWCQDWYGDYPTGLITNPKGPDKGEYRVLRGGSWNYRARSIRSAIRFRNNPGDRYYGLGFRVARDF
jgi:formylglycine-generating enzyme required for sulfatase activity